MAESIELNLRDLYAELKQGVFRRVYVLTGEEQYLVSQAKDRLLERLVNRPRKTLISPYSTTGTRLVLS